MAKRVGCRPPSGTADADDLADRLRSAVELVRLRALHSICPCGSGFSLYERLHDDVHRLLKDPSPGRPAYGRSPD